MGLANPLKSSISLRRMKQSLQLSLAISTAAAASQSPVGQLPINLDYIPDLKLYNISTNLLHDNSPQKGPSSYIEDGLCLDIGPKWLPAFPIGHKNARFLDVQSRADLVRRYADDHQRLKIRSIPDIDYVWNGSVSYAALTGGIKFSYIHASHVLEHIADPIGWFADVCEILDDDGVLEIKLPDWRFCFDYRRRPSSFSEIIAAYLENRKSPSAYSAYESHIYTHPKHIHVTPRYPDDFRFSIDRHKQALKQAYRAAQGQPNFNIHSWKWSAETFVQHLTLLNDLDLLQLKIIDGSVVPSRRYRIEFRLLLKKKAGQNNCAPFLARPGN